MHATVLFPVHSLWTSSQSEGSDIYLNQYKQSADLLTETPQGLLKPFSALFNTLTISSRQRTYLIVLTRTTQIWAICIDLKVKSVPLFNWIYSLLGSSYLCWAFSCASMLRASCQILIKELFEAGKISEDRKKKCLSYILKEENHQEIRNLIAMILLPKKLHKNDSSQTAYLKAAVSRVSS